MKKELIAFAFCLVLMVGVVSAIFIPSEDDDDTDGDGVFDADDLCAGTALGDAVNSDGCSITQICSPEDVWKNHGSYVSCVAHTAESFVAQGLISEEEKDAIVSEAGQSEIGK